MVTPIVYQPFKWGDYSIVWVNSTDIKGAIAFYTHNCLDGIGISPHHGYRRKDISFLSQIPMLRGVVIIYGHMIDISPLERRQDVRLLALSGVSDSINLNSLHALRDLSLVWNAGMELPLPENVPELRRLYIRGYSGATLSAFPEYRRLRDLQFIQASLTDITGIGRLKGLKALELSYCRQLKSVCAAAGSTSLISLHVENCRQVSDFATLSGSKSIARLMIPDCGQIRSIEFIRKMRQLREFRFGGTNVLDGDISPCLSLEKVGFMWKRHYSHTPDAVREIIAAASHQAPGRGRNDPMTARRSRRKKGAV